MPTRPPLNPAVAAARGLTPRQRAALDRQAKDTAIRFTTAVRSRSAHAVAQLTRGWTTEQWAALAIVLAESAEPGRLLATVQAADDGLPEITRKGASNAA